MGRKLTANPVIGLFRNHLWTGVWILLLWTGPGAAGQLVFPEWTHPAFPHTSPYSICARSGSRPHSATCTAAPEDVSIATLLAHGADYHQQLVRVRGRITQPELHLDESQLFFDFVFRLADAGESLVVFGRHNRTQGAPPISLDRSVEVIGVFWKQRTMHDTQVTNTIEAFSVVPYPSLIPDSA